MGKQGPVYLLTGVSTCEDREIMGAWPGCVGLRLIFFGVGTAPSDAGVGSSAD